MAPTILSNGPSFKIELSSGYIWITFLWKIDDYKSHRIKNQHSKHFAKGFTYIISLYLHKTQIYLILHSNKWHNFTWNKYADIFE